MRSRAPWAAFLGAFWPFVLGSILVAGGLAAIVIGYLGVSGTVYVPLQLPYLVSGAVLGLALVIVGTALFVVQVLTRQTRLLRRLLSEVEAPADKPTETKGGAKKPAATTARLPSMASAAGDGDGDGSGATSNGSPVYAVRGGRWFHRGGCSLLEGKSPRAMNAREAEDLGLAPCRLCDPVVPAGA